MTEDTREPVLRRMTRSGRPPPEFGEVSPAKAMRHALAKAGQDLLGQVVTGSGLEELRVGLDTIAENLPAGALCVLLHGPRDSRGLVALDRTLVAAVTEALATGRVSSGPAPNRAPTRTDAFLCMRFLVTILTVFAARLVGHPSASWATGFVPEEPVADLRRLPVLMEDVPYRLLAMETDIGAGAKIGQVCFVLPWEPVITEAEPDVAEPEVADQMRKEAWARDLHKALMPAPVTLTAVLHRVTMTLEEIKNLQPGSAISIPRSSMQRVQLVDISGKTVVTGRLGKLDGARAVRVEGEAGAPAPMMTDDEDGLPGDGPTGDAEAAGFDLGTMDAQAEGDDLPDLPPLDMAGLDQPPDGEDEDLGFPSMDMGDLDLDDLPMTIE